MTTKDGVSILDQNGRVVTGPVQVAVSTPTWSHVVTARPEGEITRVVVEDLADRRVLSSTGLAGRLEPRIVSGDGELVASVTPGGAGVYGLHQPGGRARTEVVVSGRAGERARLDLAGNIEPEVFSPDGTVLFVLEYLPAQAPDRFRLGAVDVATGRPRAVRARSGGDGPALRAHRVDRVYDERRSVLFSLYAYEPDAVAFVQCLHTGEGWTHRIDLPAPLGRERPGVHGIALSAGGDRLCVVYAPTATAVDIDPDRLVVANVARFAATGRAGKPAVRFTGSGRLVVRVDDAVIATDPGRELAMPGEARGLALGTADDVWAGHPEGVVRYDLGTGAQIGRFSVPDLYIVKHVRNTAGA